MSFQYRYNIRMSTGEKNRYFAIIADAYADKSDKEQLSFCVRTVTDSLESAEGFLGFYELENIKSGTIVWVIKDLMVRLNIQLENCRGQMYDGASNILGKKLEVATQILSQQPKAEVIHCQGHSLSLVVKDLITNCKVLVILWVLLPKFLYSSSKRESMLGRIRQNIEGEFNNMDYINILHLRNYVSLSGQWEQHVFSK